MLDRAKELLTLQMRLGVIDQVIEELFDSWLNIALAKSNRTEATPALLAIVRDTVVAAYNRSGNEGMESSDVGNQSYDYTDLEDALMKSILQANLRVYKP